MYASLCNMCVFIEYVENNINFVFRFALMNSINIFFKETISL